MTESVLRADWPAPSNIIAGTTLRSGGEADLPAAPLWLDQVHGTRAVVLGSADFDAGVPQADAVIGRRAGDICVVRTADCLPVLLTSRDGQEIAAVHAGWRGLAAGVIEATLDRMQHPSSELLAWFGPAISQAAFEVGPEVRDSFGVWGQSDTWFQENDRGRLQADLYGLAAARLQECGVSPPYGGGLCTHTDAERFYSYRRDGETGRLLSFVCRA
ncbi:MAG: peptidoglycan editing factor PgeF [Woeseiaceae bacterium]